MLCQECTQWRTGTDIGVPETPRLSNVQGDHQAYSWSTLNTVPRAVAWREIRTLNTLAIFHSWKFLKVRIMFLCQYLHSTFNFVARFCAVLDLGHLVFVGNVGHMLEAIVKLQPELQLSFRIIYF